MKTKLLILFLLCGLFFGCKTTNPVIEIPVKTETIIKERLIPVEIPADSAYLAALFECDSNYSVLLKSLNENKTKSIESNLSFVNGQLNYNAKTNRDNVFAKGIDSIIYQDRPFRVEVPVEVNKLTQWQVAQIWIGRVSMLVFLIAALIGLVKSKWKL